MSAPELKPAYLVTGNDLPKVERTLDRLRGRFDPGSIERLVVGGRDGATGPDVIVACNSGTLLAGERLVLVTEVDGRRNEWGKLSGGWKATDVEAVVEYLREPAPGTVLCLVAEQLKESSPLGKAVAKVGEVLTWDKLATWAGGEPLGVEEVEQLAAPLGEGHPWDLTDAWGERDLARVLAVIEGEYRRSARPTQEPIAFAGRLSAHVTRLAKTKSLLEHGARTADVAAALGMKEFPARKLVAQAERFSIEELRAATVRIGRLDYALKGGSKLAPDLEVQLAVADVTREHR